MQNAHPKPRISVLLPVYNAEQYLKQAVDSILEQTYENFEIIAIDDGSKDASGRLLDEYAALDSRVRVIHQENKGLVATLNRAIDLAQGEFLARQDGDDVSFTRRFEQQVAVLDTEPSVVLVSGGFEVFDQDDEFLYREVIPADDREIKRALYLRNPIGHGSVMFRKAACVEVGKYNDKVGPTEDYELWSRLAAVGKFAALEASVFHWRVNLAGITSTNNGVMVKIMRDHIGELWAREAPAVLSSRDLRIRGREYYDSYHKRGVDMKNVMLADNAQLAFKLMAHGQFLKGVHQLAAVALVGRSGLRAVYHRLHVVRQSSVDLIRQKAKFGRQDQP